MDAAAAGSAETPKWMIWTGRVMTALPILMLLPSSFMKLMKQPELTQNFTGHMGYPESTLMAVGIVELVCVVLYAVPRTATLGAVLLTAYLGGAVATHVRIIDGVSEYVPSILAGLLVWGGLFFRDARFRALLPLRRS